MKAITMLVVLILVVTMAAASGTRAATRPAVSAAYEQCLGLAGAPPERCLPLVSARRAFDDFGADRDVYAGDQFGDAGFDQGQELSSPEFWRELAVNLATAALFVVAEEVAKWAAERLRGGGDAPGTIEVQIPPALFDPVR
jgi:hypothetical protein